MKVTVYIAVSLDGFIARKNGELDWLPQPDNSGEDYGYHQFFDSVDALLMGRNTFETVLTFGGWHYGDKPVYVVSQSLKILPEVKNANLKLIAGSVSEIYSALEQKGYSKIYLDGGKLIQSFLSENLVDELIISRIPVLLGDGIPLFGALQKDIIFEHNFTKTFNSGIVQSSYIVAK